MRYSFGYKPSLDGLRAFGVLPIMMLHGGMPGFHWGFVSVDLFFVLSGFLITSILVKERSKTGTINFIQFYKRRALRLFPALTIVFVVFAIFGIFFLRSGKITITEIGISALYMSNWTRALSLFGGQPFFLAHTWSLSIEEQFYIVWPLSLFLLLKIRTDNAVKIICAVTVAVILWRAWFALSGAPDARTFNGTDMRCDGLLIGSAVAICMTNEKFSQRSISICNVLWPIAIVAMIAVTYLDAPQNYYHMALGGFTLVAVCSAVVIVAALKEGSFISRILSTKFLMWVGQRSYGLYLWHFVIITMLMTGFKLHTGPMFTILESALAFLVSAVSYRLIELPALRLKYNIRDTAVTPQQQVLVSVPSN